MRRIRAFRRVVFFLLFLGTLASLRASISEFRQYVVDFSKSSPDAKVTWSNSDLIAATDAGLGWEGEVSSSRAGWFLTEPYSIGLSWRPTISAAIKARIEPSARTEKLPNGQEFRPWVGQLYVRYSPDTKNWTSWQALRADVESFQKNGDIAFQGYLQVPNRNRVAYDRLLSEYMRMDVPWGSDEDAAVRWIISKEPRFFETSIPFIGYLQFLYENQFYGGRRITKFSADISYGMGGASMTPKDPSLRPKMGESWKYRAE